MIRPARPEDAGAIAALSGQLGYPSSANETRVRIDALEARGDHAIFVDEIDGAIVGWLTVRGDLSLEGGAFAEIAGLVVDEVHRTRGLGESLVGAAEAWALEHGYTRMRVRSNVVRTRAHRFYERLGYSITKQQAVFDKRFRPLMIRGDR